MGDKKLTLKSKYCFCRTHFIVSYNCSSCDAMWEYTFDSVGNVLLSNAYVATHEVGNPPRI
jgi:hypothetical protein